MQHTFNCDNCGSSFATYCHLGTGVVSNMMTIATQQIISVCNNCIRE